MPLVLLMALLGIVLIAATPAITSMMRQGKPGPAMVLAFGGVSLLLTIVLIRYIRFPPAFIPLLLPMAYAQLKAAPDVKAGVRLRRLVLVCSVVLIGVIFGLRLFVPADPGQHDAVDFMAYDDCKDGDFSVLKQIPPGRIAAPQALSLTLATSMPKGFSVAAVPFHRASPGMKRMFEAFVASDPEIRRQALEPIDYVAVCRFPLKPDYGSAPLYETVAAGQDWPGLVRYPDEAHNRFQLFRIDHANLR